MNNIKLENICIGRILGNYNPPKSSAQSRLQELEEIIKFEANIHADKVWVLNRIFDQDYNSKIKNILIKNNYQFYEIPFIYDDFASSKDKFSYLANINPARNFLIKKCLSQHKYAFCLDGDCFFDSDLFTNITSNLNSNPNKSYYAVMTKRVIKRGHKYDFSNVIDSEPMLVFTKNSKFFFDENTPFGANDKNELCWKLGFSEEKFIQKIYDTNITGNLCAVLGNVFHISCADQKLETDSVLRKKARIESLTQTIEAIEKIHEKSLDYRVYT